MIVKKSDKLDELTEKAEMATTTLDELSCERAKEKIDKAIKAGAKGKQHVVKLKPWHDKLLKLILFEGMRPSEVAKEVGCSLTWVCRVWRSDVGLKRMKELLETADLKVVKQKVEQLSGKAVRVLDEILDSSDPEMLELQLKVAKDVLDRIGINQPKEHKVTYEHLFKTIRDSIERAALDIEKDVEVTGGSA